MPRRTVLTSIERMSLLAIPSSEEALIQHYTFSESDISMIKQRRGEHNRLGVAVQLCYLRFPGYALPPDTIPNESVLLFVAKQLHFDSALWPQYAQRAETRREHLLELQALLGLTPFKKSHINSFVQQLTDLAQHTDRGVKIAMVFIEMLRQQRIIIPSIDVIESVCAEAITRGTRQVYESLTDALSINQQQQLDDLLLIREGTTINTLTWLRQPSGSPNAKHVLTHIERLRTIRDLNLPDGLDRMIHRSRLMKIAREGSQMTGQHLRDLESKRRHATLVAVIHDTRATLIDEIIDMHDRMLGTLFNRAKRNHADRFQQSGKAINDKVRLYFRIGQALLQAKTNGSDPFEAIESVMPWQVFTESIVEAEKLAQSSDFDYLPLIGDGFSQLRRYTPHLLEMLQLKAAPVASDLLDGIEMIKSMNQRQARKVPEEAPTSFIRKRWEHVVHTEDGLDRRFYELCVLSEMKNALRSGDIWVHGSRQFKDFEEYLLPQGRFIDQKQQHDLGLAIETECDRFLEHRLAILETELRKTELLASQNELPDATITDHGLKITPLANAVPDEAEHLMRQVYALLPHLKITDLLVEVDAWTDFTRHFTHLKTNESVTDKTLILTTILADGINLGLSKMAESCPSATYAKLSWLQAWHIRDETYSAALAELVKHQSEHPFSSWWGDGTTSSSDGQWFRAGGTGQSAGHHNAKYGKEPGVTFYTHISNQYAPFHTKVINAAVRDATHVLDGLLYHESELHIEEHYTDTAGFTDHVFGLMHLLGFRFAPRIRDLKDKKLYVLGDTKAYPTLVGLIGGGVNVKHIRTQWDDILRLAASIKQGTVTASLMLRKLGSYPRQNGLATALRELGRIERTIFTLDWMQNVELRRRVQVGLNKGEAKNALARAVFFNRLGELRDRSFENQRYRASGLNLIVAAIILWNTVYLDRAIQELKKRGTSINEDHLQHISPLGWEHINLTGDYTWNQDNQVQIGMFRPLRTNGVS